MYVMRILTCSAVGTAIAGACLSGHWFRHVCHCRRSSSSISRCHIEMRYCLLEIFDTVDLLQVRLHMHPLS